MSLRDTYLTDEELSQLIAEVESHELVPAPPDMPDDILAKITAGDIGTEQSLEEQTPSEKVIGIRGTRKEFYQYCFRVVASVAATIFLLFTVPNISEAMLKLSEAVPEVNDGYEKSITLRYATKEEALSERGIFDEAFENSNLFSDDFDWDIFIK